MPKGRRQNKRTTQRSTRVDGIERRKKEQQRGGTKEDKSLRGTTTKLVRVIPEIKEESIETNSRQRMIDLQGWQRGKNRIQFVTYPATTRRRDKRRRKKEEKEESKIEQK